MSLTEMFKSWKEWRMSLEGGDKTEGWEGGSWWAKPVFEPYRWNQKLSCVHITFCCIEKWREKCKVSSSGEGRGSMEKRWKKKYFSSLNPKCQSSTILPKSSQFCPKNNSSAWPLFSLPLHGWSSPPDCFSPDSLALLPLHCSELSY